VTATGIAGSWSRADSRWTSGNELPHSDVLTSVAAEGGKQNLDPEDNLNSGNGAEEDGVANRSDPQGWPADGSPGNPGSTPDGDQASVKTVPPLFGVGATDADKDADSGPASPASAGPATPDFSDQPSWDVNDRPTWDPRMPDTPRSEPPRTETPRSEPSRSATSNGPVGPSDWPPSPASAGPDPAIDLPLNGPSAAPGSNRYSPSGTSTLDGGPSTAQFPSPFSKGRIRPSRPPRTPKRPQPGQRPAPSLPTQGAAASRKAQLAISRIEPWSVMKFSFMISLVGWVILFVAVAVMYFVLQKIGVFTSIEHTVGLVTSTKVRAGDDASSWFSASRVLGYTMLVGAVNVILITALATIGAVLYNLVTVLAGGVEVTLKEAD
jgi:hypothetical protein